MIGWLIAGVIGIPLGLGIIKGAMENRRPSRYQQNLAQIIAEREARERAGLPSPDVRTNLAAPKVPWEDVRAQVNGRFVTIRVKRLFDLVACTAPIPTDMPQGTSFGTMINRGHRVPAIIKYIDGEASTTTRLVIIHSLNATIHKDGTITLIYFIAYCHTRNGDRTFYFRGVQAAGDPETGEIITDFPGFVLHAFGRTNPIRRIPQKPCGTV